MHDDDDCDLTLEPEKTIRKIQGKIEYVIDDYNNDHATAVGYVKVEFHIPSYGRIVEFECEFPSGKVKKTNSEHDPNFDPNADRQP